jgi:membrane-bound lytic murein transglycosylase B
LLLESDVSPADFPVFLESGPVTLTPEQTPEPYVQPDCEPDNRSDEARSWLSWRGLRFAAGLAAVALALVGVSGLAWLTWGNFPTESYAPASPRSPALPSAAPPSARSRAPVAAGASRLQPDPAWVDRVAGVTGIPARVLMAYAQASLLLSAGQPACRLGWTTLAGLGRIESEHGTLGGTHLLADGRQAVPIVGPALDGRSGFGAIPATPDSIALNGDPSWAHAIGPMQFIPSTWHRWASDGDGDGRSDPNDIDDAAYAAARYLCSSGADLTTGMGWQRAIHSYNHSDVYTAQVLDTANQYARTSGKG